LVSSAYNRLSVGSMLSSQHEYSLEKRLFLENVNWKNVVMRVGKQIARNIFLSPV
jgi:hypothetical protein